MTDDPTLRVLRPKRAAPADAVRPTRAEINLGALRSNLWAIERFLGAERRPSIFAVLKADAYGHGAPAVARTLERAGVTAIAVALLEEGIELRAAGIEIPILVMGGYYGLYDRGLDDALEHQLTPVLYRTEQIERLALLAESHGGPVGFHLKVDTGMARLGTPLGELGEMLSLIRATKSVHLKGLMSHLSSADHEDPEVTLLQLERFSEVRQRAAALGLKPEENHIANSAGALAFPAAHLDAIRPGVALYGVSPFSKPREPQPELKPVMSIRSQVVALRTLSDGQTVGYGGTYRASGERVIATLPIGYADGLSRALSGRGFTLVRGRRAPIAGIVSMDLTSIDVTDIPGVALRDEVVFLGQQDGPLGSGSITIEEIAATTGTITWEVMTNISRRVPRFYREP